MSDSRRRIIAGNWKMNCSRAEAIQLASAIVADSNLNNNVEMLICIPHIHMADISKLLINSKIYLGAQDAHWESSGAFTGEISSSMLADYQVSHLLVGHSERREMFADDDSRVAKKFAAALNYGLKPILCIGESLEQRKQEMTLEVLKSQCQAVVDVVGINAFSQAYVAYEPIWAIGTGQTATPEQAEQVHAEIRAWFAEQSKDIAAQLPILYGGSMNAANAEDLLAQDNIDGGLIGGASLKVEDFLKIYSAAG
ncbi:triose-phosphate isomerase [Aliikangiella sp. IMCC44359]|uniref:triose-phosphate isomerase n=1 Tax=Aliikangiella sp. IMCC44359 TaxID=3459125 RepID=UPI00403B0412